MGGSSVWAQGGSSEDVPGEQEGQVLLPPGDLTLVSSLFTQSPSCWQTELWSSVWAQWSGAGSGSSRSLHTYGRLRQPCPGVQVARTKLAGPVTTSLVSTGWWVGQGGHGGLLVGTVDQHSLTGPLLAWQEQAGTILTIDSMELGGHVSFN